MIPVTQLPSTRPHLLKTPSPSLGDSHQAFSILAPIGRTFSIHTMAGTNAGSSTGATFTDLTHIFITVMFSDAECMGGQLWPRQEAGNIGKHQGGAEDT